MAKKAKAAPAPVADASTVPVKRPRVHKLTIRNFRAIGKEPVTVELDDIVVLVGPNNSGKSSILRAYQVVMLHGSKDGELTQEDFPDGTIDASNPVEIELETVVYDEKAPGEKWIRKDPTTGEMFVREKWTWVAPGKPKRVGWEVGEPGNWHASEVPWGAPGVAQPARPEPHRIEAFDSPQTQTAAVVTLLKDVLNQRIKEMQETPPPADGTTVESTDYQKLLTSVSEFQKKVVVAANEQIAKIETEMNTLIDQVFPGQAVRFDARPEDNIDDCLTFFRDTPQLLMGPKNGYQPPVEKQGSGARRTLLWAALRLVKEQARAKKDATSTRPHILLIDEPELCLHPNAVREACRVLYDLPKTGNWQVMVTTHSPVFIDLWRDNTSIVRVERQPNGSASGTTIYRPKRAALDDDDKECLKLLNLCDSYVAEFFFGGRTVLVEGDTEHTAFTYVMQQEPERFKDIHVVRARGKATIVSLCKVLNQFGAPYSVLHDSDTPTAFRKGTVITNPAWTQNQRIYDQVKNLVATRKIRLVASLVSFEPAYFGTDASSEKPANAWTTLKENKDAHVRIATLLEALVDFTKPLPQGAVEWSDLAALENQLPKNPA
ncbi:MAG: AAA family ATPase [Opitutae bacterium]|jgi:putative ATP-dependent endonuclease of OLD family|nr:AAA family ATPase [Opitutae bacterium]